MNILDIPDEELQADLESCRNDIALCEMALRLDIIKYPSGNVSERLNINRKIVEAILVEQARREKKAAK